ncbi:unnamed protein product [Caretta caretta]
MLVTSSSREGKPYAANEMKLVLGTTLVLQALRLPACCAQCNPEGGSSAPHQAWGEAVWDPGPLTDPGSGLTPLCSFPAEPCPRLLRYGLKWESPQLDSASSCHRLGPIHSLSLDHKMLPSLFANGGAGSENTQLVNPGGS